MYPPASSHVLFQGAARYRALLGRRPGRVMEGAAEPAFPYSERHLWCVWYDAALRPSDLRTAEGEAVVVESPGRWNLEAGPAFLDAALLIGPDQRRLRGDVEVHVRPADWQQHGHAQNPRYRRVIAHVTYFPGRTPPGGLPAAAVAIPLRDALAANPAFSFHSIDLAAYPYAMLDNPSPCSATLATLDQAERLGILEAAGQERLRRKTERCAEALRTWNPAEWLYAEVMDALGYKQNREAFRLLAARVPLADLQYAAAGDVLRGYALLGGAAGLLPARPRPNWDADTRDFLRRLWDCWWKQQARWQSVALPRGAWTLAGLRPANQPLRRLMAAAALFCGPQPLPDRLQALESRIASSPPDGSEVGDWIPTLLSWLEQSGRETFWSHRLGLGGARRAKPVALVGAGRAAAIVTNVLVPFLAARGAAVGLAPDWLRPLPPDDENAVVRQMAAAFLGPDRNPALYRTGLRQQGLMQIFHDFCLAQRAGCRECPFPGLLQGDVDQPLVPDPD